MVHANGSARHDAKVGRPPPGDAPFGPSQRRLFPGEERELQRVRSWLAGLLPDCPARDDLISVAVELGTNAIRHTLSGRGGWFTVEVAWHGPVVRVAVADDGAATGPRVNGDTMSDSGRGLVIVHALSTRTGVSGNHFGRTVWAEIPWGADPVPMPAAAPDRRPVPAANPRSGG
jgi:anti-sigma regulatory factor (Ser/Thr protein kinase)